jgi:hypothetical protein
MLEKISYVPQKIQTSSRRIADTNYSNLSKEFVSKLSVKNTASNLTIYIEPKLNGIARYIADKFNITGMYGWIFIKRLV